MSFVPGGIQPVTELQKLSARLARIEAALGGSRLTFGTFTVEYPGGTINSGTATVSGLPATVVEVFLSPDGGFRCGISYAITSATQFQAAICTAEGSVPAAGAKQVVSYIAVSK